MFEEYGAWWQRASWPARIPATVGVIAAAGLVLLVANTLLRLVLSLLGWLGSGAVQLVGHDGVHALAAWQISHVITDPIRHYMALGANTLPVSASTLLVFWLVAAAGLWMASLLGVRGARLGWMVIGAATVAMVYAGTAPAGRGLAAGVAAAAWALLSIPAYWAWSPHTTNLIHVHNKQQEQTRERIEGQADAPTRPAGALDNPIYRRARKKVVDAWQSEIGGEDGMLPGAVLVDVTLLTGGWVATGQLDAARATTVSRVLEAADEIAAAYHLPAGAVLVEQHDTADLFTVRAFESPAGADYQHRCPLIPLTVGREFVGEHSPAGQLSGLNRAELADWARKYADVWQAMRGGDRVDVEQYWRRLTRLRGGILDAVPLAAPGEVAEILTACGLAFDALPEELAEAAGLHRRRGQS